ncbi:MAG: hypothetical protein ACJA13_004157 [Paraglaciecola sp.]|jgi:hypothetical protein
MSLSENIKTASFEAVFYGPRYQGGRLLFSHVYYGDRLYRAARRREYKANRGGGSNVPSLTPLECPQFEHSCGTGIKRGVHRRSLVYSFGIIFF